MSIGVYIHIPFCGKKCPYCDFYSAPASNRSMDRYTATMTERLEAYRNKGVTADTLYFGGGTPNLLGGERLSRLIQTARDVFAMPANSEITVEANPATATPAFFRQIFTSGTNRLSLGLQSANSDELAFLGRRHTQSQAAAAVKAAREAGFSNISLDLMIGLPGQTTEQLGQSIAFCANLGVEHVSSYLLKIEEGTPFFARRNTLSLPDEDAVSELYFFAVEELARQGFAQYEISNFAKPGYEGRHNLKYWHCEEYLGFGPAAHSFFDGQRFYSSRSLEDFFDDQPPISDGKGGSREEFLMLSLRLTEGVSDAQWQLRFGEPLPSSLLQAAHRYESPGLIAFDNPDRFHLTPKGFLVSNPLLRELLDTL